MIRNNVQEKHLIDCKLLPTRDDIIRSLPTNSIIAELGVFRGEFARRIFNYSTPKKLYLVDTWPQDKVKKEVETIFSNEIENSSVELIHESSTDYLLSVEDNFFDWVYLDTSHTYNQTVLELNLLKNKVKQGGYIAGHDFCNGNPQTGNMYGVIPACHNFCIENDWKYVFLSVDVLGHFSYCLKRI